MTEKTTTTEAPAEPQTELFPDAAAKEAYGESERGRSVKPDTPAETPETPEAPAKTEEPASPEAKTEQPAATEEPAKETPEVTYDFEGVDVPKGIPTQTAGELKDSVEAWAKANGLNADQAKALYASQLQGFADESAEYQEKLKAENQTLIKQTKDAYGDKLSEATNAVQAVLTRFGDDEIAKAFPNAEALYASPLGFRIFAKIGAAMGESGKFPTLDGKAPGSGPPSEEEIAKQHFG